MIKIYLKTFFILVMGPVLVIADDLCHPRPNTDVRMAECLESLAIPLEEDQTFYSWGSSVYHNAMVTEDGGNFTDERFVQLMGQDYENRLGGGLYIAPNPQASSGYSANGSESLLVVILKKGTRFLDMDNPIIQKRLLELGIGPDYFRIRTGVNPKVAIRFNEFGWTALKTNQGIKFERFDPAKLNDWELTGPIHNNPRNGNSSRYFTEQVQVHILSTKKNGDKFCEWENVNPNVKNSPMICKEFTFVFNTDKDGKTLLGPPQRKWPAEKPMCEESQCPVKYLWGVRQNRPHCGLYSRDGRFVKWDNSGQAHCKMEYQIEGQNCVSYTTGTYRSKISERNNPSLCGIEDLILPSPICQKALTIMDEDFLSDLLGTKIIEFNDDIQKALLEDLL